METIDNRTWKEKVQEACWRAGERIKGFGRWCSQNPEAAVGLGVFIASGIAGGVSAVSEIKKQDEAKAEKRRIWDPAMGISIYSKRPLNGAEKLEFEQRVRMGQGRADALDDMGLLDRKR